MESLICLWYFYWLNFSDFREPPAFYDCLYSSLVVTPILLLALCGWQLQYQPWLLKFATMTLLAFTKMHSDFLETTVKKPNWLSCFRELASIHVHLLQRWQATNFTGWDWLQTGESITFFINAQWEGTFGCYTVDEVSQIKIRFHPQEFGWT